MDIISLLQQVAGFRNRLHFIMPQKLAGSRKKERAIDFVRSAIHDGCIRAKTDLILLQVSFCGLTKGISSKI